MPQEAEFSMDDFNKPRLRFVARGNTYPHREKLRSWAWHWDRKRRLWVNENEISADSMCIRVIADLPSMTVSCEGPIEGS